jgi:hypothetical protein
MSDARTLGDLAAEVNTSLQRPEWMTVTRAIVDRYLSGVADGTIESVIGRLPTNPVDDSDWTMESLLEQDHDGPPPLTPEQTVVAMVVFHDVHCWGVEKVVPTPMQLGISAEGAKDGQDSPEYLRWCRLKPTMERVRQCGAYALPWFKLRFARYVEILSTAVPPPQASVLASAPPQAAPAASPVGTKNGEGGIPPTGPEPEPAGESSANGDARLTPAELRAWNGYEQARRSLDEEQGISEPTDREAYHWLVANEHLDPKKAKWDGWKKALERARKKLDQNKYQRRAAYIGRSAVSRSEYDDERQRDESTK